MDDWGLDDKPVPTIFFLEDGTFIDLFNKWDSLFRVQTTEVWLKYWPQGKVNSCCEDKQIKLQIYDTNEVVSTPVIFVVKKTYIKFNIFLATHFKEKTVKQLTN